MNSIVRNLFFDDSEINIPEIKELLSRTEERVFLLIKARWAFIIILLAYSLFAFIFYKANGLLYITRENYLVPAITFVFLISYNSWYHLTYKWFCRIRGANSIQIIFDVMYVTILIHYSGGILSWIWAIYPLLVIEAALLLDNKIHTVILALVCFMSYGVLVFLEHFKIIHHFAVPMTYGLKDSLSYKLLFLSWLFFVLVCFAIASTYLMGVFSEEEEELKRQVVIDGLTNLYNRNYLFYRLNSEIERSRRFGHTASIILLDLDGFKDINDHFGHLEGDFLLKKVAEIFTNNIRRHSNNQTYDVDLPCRYGGDEFVIILPETKEANAAMVGERIRRDIFNEGNNYLRERNLFKSDKHGTKYFNISLSVGIASYPDHADSSDALISKADEALYHAKTTGKNKVVLASELSNS